MILRQIQAKEKKERKSKYVREKHQNFKKNDIFKER